MTWQRVSLIAGTIATVFALLSGAWAAGSHFGFRPALVKELEEVANVANTNQRQLMILKFLELDGKRQRVGLTPTERAIWCDLGLKLKYIRSC